MLTFLLLSVVALLVIITNAEHIQQLRRALSTEDIPQQKSETQQIESNELEANLKDLEGRNGKGNGNKKEKPKPSTTDEFEMNSYKVEVYSNSDNCNGKSKLRENFFTSSLEGDKNKKFCMAQLIAKKDGFVATSIDCDKKNNKVIWYQYNKCSFACGQCEGEEPDTSLSVDFDEWQKLFEDDECVQAELMTSDQKKTKMISLKKLSGSFPYNTCKPRKCKCVPNEGYEVYRDWCNNDAFGKCDIDGTIPQMKSTYCQQKCR